MNAADGGALLRRCGGRGNGIGRAVPSLLLAAALSGCALINPYVEVEPANRPPASPTFAQAIDYADQMKETYRQSAGDYAELKNILGAGLIPLGAAALGLGMTGGDPSVITGLALGGAAAYGTGTFLYSKPTELAYVLGFNATNCAEDAVIPFNVDRSSGAYTNFHTAYDAIDGEIKTVQLAMSAVRAILGSGRAPEAQKLAAEQSLTEAAAAVDSAVNARQNATALIVQIDNAPDQLVTAVDRIRGEVYKAIQTNETDLAAAAAIVSGLGQAYSKFTFVPQTSATGVAKSPTAPGPKALALQLTPAASLPDALYQLSDSVATLQMRTRAVADFVNAVVASKPTEKLKACGVDPNSLAADISIDPPGPVSVAGGKAASLMFLIKGGSRPYRAMLSDASAKGLSVTQPDLFGPAFSVNVAADAAPGNYGVYAADASGRQGSVQVIVQAAENLKPGAGDGTDASQAVFGKYDESQRKNIQTALCLKDAAVDGIWGPVTQNALKTYQTATSKQADGVLTQPLADELLKQTPDQIAARCK